jgi:hypothetical protein
MKAHNFWPAVHWPCTWAFPGWGILLDIEILCETLCTVFTNRHALLFSHSCIGDNDNVLDKRKHLEAWKMWGICCRQEMPVDTNLMIFYAEYGNANYGCSTFLMNLILPPGISKGLILCMPLKFAIYSSVSKFVWSSQGFLIILYSPLIYFCNNKKGIVPYHTIICATQRDKYVWHFTHKHTCMHAHMRAHRVFLTIQMEVVGLWWAAYYKSVKIIFTKRAELLYS